MSDYDPVNGENIQKKIHDIFNDHEGVFLYENSFREKDGVFYFIIRQGLEKFLIAASGNPDDRIFADFTGEKLIKKDLSYIRCQLIHNNAEAVRERFDFASPVLIGKENSYGFGDRLGNAGPAHLRAVRKSGFKPVLAQQSIRELERTRRTAGEVIDAATWSVFQEGYTDGFGADGDHLKTPEDIDMMVESGFTMFTIDPSEYVVNEVTDSTDRELRAAYRNLPWRELEDEPDSLLKRLSTLNVQLRNDFLLSPSQREVLQGMVKYGRVITHTKKLADYLSSTYPRHPAELELSVDETDEPTTLFEHYLVASELHRLGVDLVSLAPRFCGHFEKGVDFRGDLDQFRTEYIQHLAIAEQFGGYKLSIHSGSDKFSVYEVIGSIDMGRVHVKTAGTSYLEALRTIAVVEPELFRRILKFSISRFEEDKKTYHISADPERIPDPAGLDGRELAGLLNDNDARQVLHVAFGSVLSGVLPEAESFKEELMNALERHEDLHEMNLITHFNKHLNPFTNQRQSNH